MFIAAKYEEIFPPSIDKFVYISDGTYTRDEVTCAFLAFV
jgi:cyclin A